MEIKTKSKELVQTKLWKKTNNGFFFRFDIFPFVLTHIVLILIFTFIEEKDKGWFSHWELYFIFAVITGLLQIITFLGTLWSVPFKCWISYQKTLIQDASFVEVRPIQNRGKPEICEIVRKDNQISFTWTKKKFIYNSTTNSFEKLDFPVSKTFKEYISTSGLSNKESEKLSEKYGKNQFDIPLPKFWTLYKEQATAPFFVFQIFCVGLWLLDEYWYYSLFTLVLLLCFELTVVLSRLKTLTQLRSIDKKTQKVYVWREKKWNLVISHELLPGDIVCLPKNEEINSPCDMLLLQGHCVVNEAMLTGESIPHRKEPIGTLPEDQKFNIKEHKLHTIFSGTKIIQQGNAKEEPFHINAKDNGCICYVLQTGFHTTQGKLLRMILFSTERVTANTKEAFLFLGFLLIFALLASGYVLKHGLDDENRSRYKLLLNCTWIITAVVPPELPMQLSLAVNSSLLALSKLAVFCTEPFRIPLAGKIDICCFDKTGTLTTDDIKPKGFVKSSNQIIPLYETSLEVQRILVGCQTTTWIDSKIIGNPMEVATLDVLNVSFTHSETITFGFKNQLKIHERYYFSSKLKRMSCIISSGGKYFVVSKGAPEKLAEFFQTIPENYYSLYREYAQQGYRILSLGYRELSNYKRRISREKAETNLIFVGFILFETTLKKDSAEVISLLKESSHSVAMITGDSLLTACHVSSQVEITTKPILILEKQKDKTFLWCDQKDSEKKFNISETLTLSKIYDFCVSGEVFSSPENLEKLKKFLGIIKVFARVTPEEKEYIMVELRELGLTTMMVGDGSNDVGALKQAHVGVSVINNEQTEKELIQQTREQQLKVLRQKKMTMEQRLKEAQKETEELDRPIVQLGDASIASPFTSKRCSISPVLNIIKQGRCTLVTTHQMFKILALNCLITAYGLSVLHLDGVKLGDSQATISGFLIAICFLFISRSQPLSKLSSKRPTSKLFNTYMITSILTQFAIHLFILISVINEAHREQIQMEIDQEICFDPPDPDSHFMPNLINTCVFLISTAMQIATFAINYKGHPFMQSIFENKGLLYTLSGIAALILILCSGSQPDLNELFQMTPFPSENFSLFMISAILADWFFSFAADRILQRFLE